MATSVTCPPTVRGSPIVPSVETVVIERWMPVQYDVSSKAAKAAAPATSRVGRAPRARRQQRGEEDGGQCEALEEVPELAPDERTGGLRRQDALGWPVRHGPIIPRAGGGRARRGRPGAPPPGARTRPRSRRPRDPADRRR